MSTTRSDTRTEATGRRLGPLGKALSPRLSQLQRNYLHQSSTARAELAKLRRGLGKPAGSVPEIWELTIGAASDAMIEREPSRYFDEDLTTSEQAAHAALTLYAAHQQSRTEPMHVPTVTFGRAVRQLADHDSRSKEAVVARFMATATAESIDELLVHVRGLIKQMRSARIGFDYAMFADDIDGLLRPARAQSVRLAWGRAFHRQERTTESNADDID
ncbi:type I-E CRISPR-associated protein Cse2/CasB [Nocardia cyriacigeorgica]|uniref:type I-E CRISPR-associated protein Cse2/CasB n=1 Tax=Nocardia cyriacigeorgica TaxID=135487 RepID=UPI002455F504|nr:type I-E CRISPR-associated protein Cse2/CasB [Nocardia cyriacigeorgica]